MNKILSHFLLFIYFYFFSRRSERKWNERVNERKLEGDEQLMKILIEHIRPEINKSDIFRYNYQ